jgi:NADH-quinone oxidoreductase subunit A
MMAIIFLVFDVEVALLYPWAAMFRRLQGDGHLTLLILEGASFAAALVVALVHVIRSGLLEWGEKSEGRGQELKEKS